MDNTLKGSTSIPIGDDLELHFEYTYYYQKAKVFGPPENCYPEEEDIDIFNLEICDMSLDTRLETYFLKEWLTEMEERTREDACDEYQNMLAMKAEHQYDAMMERKYGY